MCAPVCRGQEMASDPLELELQVCWAQVLCKKSKQSDSLSHLLVPYAAVLKMALSTSHVEGHSLGAHSSPPFLPEHTQLRAQNRTGPTSSTQYAFAEWMEKRDTAVNQGLQNESLSILQKIWPNLMH